MMKNDSGENNARLVETGYDKIAELYTSEREKFVNWDELEEFCAIAVGGGRVLDVGCGTGIPVAKYLVGQGYQVEGIDLSATMISAAKANVPSADFTKMNMLEMDFAPGSFDGLVSCFSVFHVPREKHLRLFETFYRLLKTGGPMLVSLGPDNWQGTEEYFGVEMFWSHYAPEKSLALITQVGFKIVFNRMLVSNDEKHYWVLAKKS